MIELKQSMLASMETVAQMDKLHGSLHKAIYAVTGKDTICNDFNKNGKEGGCGRCCGIELRHHNHNSKCMLCAKYCGAVAHAREVFQDD